MALLPPTLNVGRWTAEEVAAWIKGLDSCMTGYASAFLQRQVTGRHLLVLVPDDLEQLGIAIIGHQELICEAKELLVNTTGGSDWETLQTVALRVSTRAKCLRSQLRLWKAGAQGGRDIGMDSAVLSAGVHMIAALNELIHWLSRPPFSSMLDFVDLWKQCVKDGASLASALLRNKDGRSRADLEASLNELLGRCDDLIQNSTDSLVIQPAFFETVIMRRKHSDDELGMVIVGSPLGTFEVKRIKKESTAESSGKLEEGDEIVQVNCQTIVGWCLKSVVQLLRERPGEVVLTVRRRPRHFVTPSGPSSGSAANTMDRNIVHKQLLQPQQMQQVQQQQQQPVPSNRQSRGDVQQEQQQQLQQPSPCNRLSRGEVSTTSASATATAKLATYPKSQRKHLSTASDDSRGTLLSTSSGCGLLPSSSATAATAHDSQDSIKDDEVFDSADGQPAVTSAEGTSEPLGTSLFFGELEAASRPRILITADPSDKHVSVPTATIIGSARSSQSVGDRSQLSPAPFVQPSLPGSPDRRIEIISSPGKQEYLSSFHVVRSVPELRNLTSANSSFASTQAEQGHVSDTSSSAFVSLGQKHIDFSDNSVPSPGLCSERAAYVDEKSSSKSSLNSVSDLDHDDMAAHMTVQGKDVHLSASYATVHKREKKGREAVGGRGATRFISVVDLGRGDHEGWLYMKGRKTDKWSKTYKWCVLKQQDLLCYSDKTSVQASCYIYLPMFKVSDAPECKGKSFPFKVYNAGTSFFFAADKSEDRVEWLRRLGLAAISYNSPVAAADEAPTASGSFQEGGFCDSDSESVTSTRSRVAVPVISRRKTRLEQALGSNDAFRHMVKSIREANLDITGVDTSTRHLSRLSLLSSTARACSDDLSIVGVGRLHVKRRQLTALVQELRDIEEVEREPTPEKLKAFALKYDWVLPALTGVSAVDRPEVSKECTDVCGVAASVNEAAWSGLMQVVQNIQNSAGDVSLFADHVRTPTSTVVTSSGDRVNSAVQRTQL